MITAKHIHVTGVVQGVGFRPFVYGLAARLDLRGWVRNSSAGVDIEVQGQKSKVENFVHSLATEAPPLARIDSIKAQDKSLDIEYSTFDIQPSTFIEGAFQPISPDTALCADCEREMFDPKDRRYLYPFINCTNCGPRFTIIKDLPYDRPITTMADFPMCGACRAEYENPLDRRFHAQPIACPGCGPFVQLRNSSSGSSLISNIDLRLSAVLKARQLLSAGKIIAVKGLGGFHLACDATDEKSIEELRQRKGRAGKPFALMFANIGAIQRYCDVNEEELALLTGHEKPIVLLNIKIKSKISESVAPHMDTLGVMLPYTPLHHLLLNQTDPALAAQPAPFVLVMTSGNFSEEPIAINNEDALERLAPLADAFLLHNRDIHIRCDDSVVRVNSRKRRPEPVEGSIVERQITIDPLTIYLRRSRAYAPYPVSLPFDSKSTLAVGGELKNTFCLTRDRYAFLSQHIGDMENAEVYESFEQNVEYLSRLFRIQPEIIAYDMHPNYFTTAYAQRSTLHAQRLAVQHHHAHIASCMADNKLDNRKVIGLSFDGTGYGTDGAIWGGEVLLASYADFERVAHLEYLPLPGGDSAIRNPWRVAVGYAESLGLDITDLPFLESIESQAVDIVRQQVQKNLNAPLTSSMGRLFDAAASLINIRNDVTYEAQAAIEMEVLSKPYIESAKPYPYVIEVCHSEGAGRPKSLSQTKTETVRGVYPEQSRRAQGDIICLKELLTSIIQDVRAKESAGMIGARFHNTIAKIAVDSSKHARKITGINEVALSGGVWQNQILLDLVGDGLEQEGFVVYFHKQVPTNDGGLALGQAVIANHVVARSER
ncbi:MAG: carbamoyltransferase HypF [Anaerolineales bacterium]|nr:carbamoyltransferase HypF [Anaerolineales bacterium]